MRQILLFRCARAPVVAGLVRNLYA